jgi:hypothetical protein
LAGSIYERDFYRAGKQITDQREGKKPAPLLLYLAAIFAASAFLDWLAHAVRCFALESAQS